MILSLQYMIFNFTLSLRGFFRLLCLFFLVVVLWLLRISLLVRLFLQWIFLLRHRLRNKRSSWLWWLGCWLINWLFRLKFLLSFWNWDFRSWLLVLYFWCSLLLCNNRIRWRIAIREQRVCQRISNRITFRYRLPHTRINSIRDIIVFLFSTAFILFQQVSLLSVNFPFRK